MTIQLQRNAAKWKAAVEQDNLLREVAYPAIRGKPFPKTATNRVL